MGIFAIILGIVWLVFPFAMLNFASKQREANRVIVGLLKGIHEELRQMREKTGMQPTRLPLQAAETARAAEPYRI